MDWIVGVLAATPLLQLAGIHGLLVAVMADGHKR
jgi:hypothetical protein